MLALSSRKQRPFPSFISSQVHNPHQLWNYSGEHFPPRATAGISKTAAPAPQTGVNERLLSAGFPAAFQSGSLRFFSPVFIPSLSKHLCSAKWSRLVVICDVRCCKPSVCVSAKVTCFCLFFPNSFAPAVAAAATAAAVHLAKVTLRCFIFHPELDMWSSKNTRPPLIFLVSPSSRLRDAHVHWAKDKCVGRRCSSAAMAWGGAVLELLTHIQLY